jgi:hypothetical protein
MNDLPDVMERLNTRLDALEQRVFALEHPADSALAEPAAGVADLMPMTAGTSSSTLAAAERVDELPVSVSGGTFPVLGRAMLGIAGAYLLRAVAETSSLPRAAVAAVAIGYALAWLVGASRAKVGDWLTGTAYACTSALILAPMLWELTLRFSVLTAPATAGVVCGFVIAATALAWKREFAPVLWVANVMAAALALALSIASHQMIPFIALLLVMVTVCEYGAGKDRETGVRVLVALAADAAIWALIYIYSGPQSARTDYPSMGTGALLAPGLLLFLILGASLIYRTVLKGKTITVFETIETMIAFLLAACSVIYFGPPASAKVLGVFCIVLSCAGYAAAFTYFDRKEEKRNTVVFATWSGALLLAGSLLCLPTPWQSTLLGGAAIAATFGGARRKRLALELHGVIFLLVAAALSGLLNEVVKAMAGTLAGTPPAVVFVVSACSVLCYAAIRPCSPEPWKEQVVLLIFAALAVGAVAGLVVEGLTGLMALRMIPEAHHLAFIRTLCVCATAIALAFSGAHWRRMELTRIGYATVALIGVKLVFEDLRHGHLAFIAGSIFLFAMTLIVVPRVAHMGQRIQAMH